MEAIVIIGAGPAGCVAAILLGRAGFPVILIEQRRYPRDKVCGECLSDLGISVLEQLDLTAQITRDLHPTILSRAIFFAAGGESLDLTLPRPMWGISRLALDNRLLSSAAEVACIMQPVRCEKIVPAARQIILRDLQLNEVSTLSYRFLLVADGRGGLLCSDARSRVDLGIKSHWRDIDAPRDAIELFGVRGHYGGIAPVEDGTFNASFSVPIARVSAFAGNLDALFCNIVAENRELSRQMRSARRTGKWHAAPLPRAPVAENWPAGIFPIGNAAAALEPIGGEGMGLAMRSAQIVAEEMIRARHDGRPPDTAAIRLKFKAQWGRRSLICRAAAQVVSRPALAAPIIDLLNCVPALSRTAMLLAGK